MPFSVFIGVTSISLRIQKLNNFFIRINKKNPRTQHSEQLDYFTQVTDDHHQREVETIKNKRCLKKKTSLEEVQVLASKG
jgi:hypothetical protein